MKLFNLYESIDIVIPVIYENAIMNSFLIYIHGKTLGYFSSLEDVENAYNNYILDNNLIEDESTLINLINGIFECEKWKSIINNLTKNIFYKHD